MTRPIDRVSARAGLLLIGLLLAMANSCAGRNEPEPPRPSLETVEPLVAQRILAAQEAIENNPGTAETWGRLGEIFDIHDLTAEAVSCYEQAAKLDPAEWRWPYFLGILLRSSDQRRTLAGFTRAAELAPGYAPIHFYLGHGRFLAEDLDGAERHYLRALELDPALVNAMLGLARISLVRGDPGTALAQLERAARTAPTEAAVYTHLATAYLALGDTASATAAQRRAAAAHPAQAGGMASLADPVREELVLREGVSLEWLGQKSRILTGRGRHDEALEVWRAAIETDPPSIPALVESARLLVALGRLDEAGERVRQALALDPGSADGQALLGEVLSASGDRRGAVNAYRKAIEIDPTEVEARTDLARLLFETGRIDEALELLRAASHLRPRSAEVRFNLARALAWADRLSDAATEATEAIEIDPGHADARALLGEVSRGLWHQLRFAEAIDALRVAASGPDELPELSRQLAWALATCPREELRDGSRARVIASRLCEQTDYKHPQFLDTLAAAQAEAGDFPGAVASIRTAVAILERLRSTNGPRERRRRAETMLEQLRARQSLYESRRPYHGR